MSRSAATVEDSPASPKKADLISARLGNAIRVLRHDKGMTLTALAEQTGLSVGLLSQVERGLSEPSVKAIHLIATALGVSIGWFFREEGPVEPAADGITVRRGHRKTLDYGGGIVDELLSPSLEGQLELLLCRLAPGASVGSEAYTHIGEEAGYVMAGSLELIVDGVTHLLNTGDSFGFASVRPHKYRNISTQETVVIWAITPPSY
ncbi:helix-turn-helix domain-containing protein [Ancylobacter amanitiformis]|uniref:Transcriptional regulator with XRE-family HTH domain n=1 Tax=Ancylobacter amanitiformis TaxID=217069 RepID=A0ABU0LPC1_9HYPH|nr:XRE family transcriptional regulator [Ancylobacter amanitiformis]MDQ0510542.1 transcriptional regulator with XRE-family HTH domain [Ancylobacter amanitiformis]